MYMILWWTGEDSYLTAVKNEDNSIKLFETIKEADQYANKQHRGDDMRVISIEGVNE